MRAGHSDSTRQSSAATPSVGFVLTGLYAAAKAIQDAYAHLLEHGSSAGLEDAMLSFDEFGELVGLEERYRLDEKFGVD